jgi:hypothetical protein
MGIAEWTITIRQGCGMAKPRLSWIITPAFVAQCRVSSFLISKEFIHFPVDSV